MTGNSKSSDSQAILTTAYLPPVDYFTVLCSHKVVYIESWENYQKQSYRNRANIYGSTGLLPLSIPVVKSGNHTLIRDVKIDYTYSWLQQHKRALISAYKSSPFFDYYQDDLFPILDAREEFLLDLNMKLLFKLVELCSFKVDIRLTGEYKPAEEINALGIADYRNTIHPKIKSPIFTDRAQKAYYQVFSEKYGFIPNLSVADLLFNEGPESISKISILR